MLRWPGLTKSRRLLRPVLLDGGPTHEHREPHWHRPFQFFLWNNSFQRSAFSVLPFQVSGFMLGGFRISVNSWFTVVVGELSFIVSFLAA